MYWKCDPLGLLLRFLPYASLYDTGLILGLRRANERRRYFVATSLIRRARTENQPCYTLFSFTIFNVSISALSFKNTVVLSFCIDVVLTLSILLNTVLHQVEELFYILTANTMECSIYESLHIGCHCISTNATSGATHRK